MFFLLSHSNWATEENYRNETYLGVTFSSETAAEARLLIDKVKNYTNLLVVDSGPVSKNETTLDEICEYAANAKLSIIVYFGNLSYPWQLEWMNNAKQKWGDYFLGIYLYDEPAGTPYKQYLALRSREPTRKLRKYDQSVHLRLANHARITHVENARKRSHNIHF